LNYQYLGQDFLLDSDPFDHKRYSDEKRELYKRLYSRETKDTLEFAFSDFCEFLNLASLKRLFYLLI